MSSKFFSERAPLKTIVWKEAIRALRFFVHYMLP